MAAWLQNGGDLVELGDRAALLRAQAVRQVFALDNAVAVAQLAAAGHVTPPRNDGLDPEPLAATVLELLAQSRGLATGLAQRGVHEAFGLQHPARGAASLHRLSDTLIR